MFTILVIFTEEIVGLVTDLYSDCPYSKGEKRWLALELFREFMAELRANNISQYTT